jgi:hypothetical protein
MNKLISIIIMLIRKNCLGDLDFLWMLIFQNVHNIDIVKFSPMALTPVPNSDQCDSPAFIKHGIYSYRWFVKKNILRWNPTLITLIRAETNTKNQSSKIRDYYSIHIQIFYDIT